jgi:hypothetical protein
MNSKEQFQLDIVVKISTGLIPRNEGQKILNVSERTLRRHLSDYSKLGVIFIKHGNTQRAPMNKSTESLQAKVLGLVKEKYFDFNMTHCLEKLKNDDGIEVKRETFRSWCHGIQMVKKAKRRAPKVRKRRERMQQTGLMLQMDGSPHHWFGGKPSCLIAAIDDADSDVPFGEFFPAEDTLSCMRVLQKIIEKRGIFQILYTDRAGIFGGQKRAQFSQVKRALKELGIHIIFANSPEAKGRIERLWGTFQDRLIPEKRIRDITTYKEANLFLQEQFLPGDYAAKFKVIPENLQTAYKPLPTGIDLSEVFCLKENRTVNRDHTFSWESDIYRIESPLKHSIYNQKIEIRTYQNVSWKVFFADRELQVSLVKKPKKADQVEIPVSQVKALEAEEKGDIPQIGAQKVRQDGHVVYQNHYYSVAEKYIGSRVSTCMRDAVVLVYCEGKVIESHPKLKGRLVPNSTKPEHMGPWRRAMSEASLYRRAGLKLGPDVEQFILMVLERGNGFIDNQTIWGVVHFSKTYSNASLNEACRFAMDIGSATYRAVKGYLKLHDTRFKQPLDLAG